MARRGKSHACAGQATGEYVGLLLVVAVVIAAAATSAVAVPGLGERIVATVRTGLCLLGGDFCRPADAAAAGLAPCLTREASRREGTSVDIAVVRVGDHGEWQLAAQSDGRARVTRLESSDIGGTLGVGVEYSPGGVDAGVSGAVVAGYRSGRAWSFPDVRSARGFLAGAMRDRDVRASRDPDVRWHALGGTAGGGAGASLAGLAEAGLAVGTDAALGVRTEGARRTVTVDLGATSPHFSLSLPGLPGAPGPRSAVVADVSWEHGALRELALRTLAESGGRQEEWSVRLDLREPRSRALAERLLRPGGDSGDMTELARLGVVERTSYRVSERRRGLSVSGRLGLALGLEHEVVVGGRRLVDAVAWIRGGAPQRRLDCLGP